MNAMRRAFTDHEVREWMQRHDLENMGLTDARAAIEDAQSMDMLPAACTHDRTTPRMYCVKCDACGFIRTDSGWGLASNQWFASMADAHFFQKHGRMPGARDA